MTLPRFTPDEDPGPNFTGVLRRMGLDPFAPPLAAGGAGGFQGGAGGFQGGAGAARPPFEITHGTTIAALRYADGVVMAGDRRATAGSSIAHRWMEKVYPADRHSGVAIAGSAGLALEMVKLFQLQLEHYEKVEGRPLSLEGKANQLSQMVRLHLSMAMQGFVVVPLFAGFDVSRGVGRIYTYDPTGGRYEEIDFHADGSGGRDARTTIKLGWRDDLTRDQAIELAVSALWQAADEDSATGGPDVIRGIYPTVATISAGGYEAVSSEQVGERFAAVVSQLQAAGNGAGGGSETGSGSGGGSGLGSGSGSGGVAQGGAAR